MKKILTVSLFAVMAVSAAHADIASTNYVGAQISTFKTTHVDPINTTIGTWGDAQKAVGTDVATAVVNLSGKMNGTGDGSVANLIATAKQEAIDAAAGDATTKANTALADAKDYADGLATNYDASGSAAQALTDAKAYTDTAATATDGTLTGGFVKTYVDEKAATAKNEAISAAATDATTKANTAEQNAKADTAAKIAALTGVTGNVAADGQYVVQTTEANGIVTVSRQAFDSAISTEANAQHSTVTAPTTKAVATYVADQMVTVTTQANSAQNAVEAIYKKVGDVETGILPTIQNDLEKQIAAEKTRAEGVEATLDTAVKAAQKAAEDEATRAKAAEEQIATYDAQGNLTGGSVKANADAIAEMKDATKEGSLAKQVADKQDKSSADFQVGNKEGGWTLLSQIANAQADCSDKTCALTIVKGNLVWEEVQE